MLLDSQQKIVQQKLNELALELENQAQATFFKKIFAPQKHQKGFYIYGDVGRGKSMLMKNFFAQLTQTPKIHFHFNSFMRAIHEGLRDIRREEKIFADELIESVKRVVKKNKVICFDEFQVLDIADAMLLSRIFTFLFEQKIVAVFTANLPPLQLYKNGLQREVFLQFVENILLKNCQVLHLNSPTDYRAQIAQNLAERYFVSSKANRQKVTQIIESLVGAQKPKTTKIEVWGREIKVRKTFELKTDPVLRRGDDFFVDVNSNKAVTLLREGVCEPTHSSDNAKTNPITKKIAIFTFAQLCQVNFAAADYQAICQKFDLIFLLKLPKLTSEDSNQAKRLMLFIDEIYENKTALIVLAKTIPQQIYQTGIGCEAFARAVSRLNEINSNQYWQSAKVNLLKKL